MIVYLGLDSKFGFRCEFLCIVLSFQCSIMVIGKQEPRQCVFCTKSFFGICVLTMFEFTMELQ